MSKEPPGQKRAPGARIVRRASSGLTAAAKKRVGASSDPDFIEIVPLALALEDNFGAKLVRRKGIVPQDIDLSFDLDASGK
jgi:hypothetical protein